MSTHRRRRRGITPPILKFGTRRTGVNFMPRPIHSPRKEPRYPLNREVGGPQNRSGWFMGTEKYVVSTGIRTPGCPTRLRYTERKKSIRRVM
jgi:hypothetical protein